MTARFKTFESLRNGLRITLVLALPIVGEFLAEPVQGDEDSESIPGQESTMLDLSRKMTSTARARKPLRLPPRDRLPDSRTSVLAVPRSRRWSAILWLARDQRPRA